MRLREGAKKVRGPPKKSLGAIKNMFKKIRNMFRKYYIWKVCVVDTNTFLLNSMSVKILLNNYIHIVYDILYRTLRAYIMRSEASLFSFIYIDVTTFCMIR